MGSSDPILKSFTFRFFSSTNSYSIIQNSRNKRKRRLSTSNDAAFPSDAGESNLSVDSSCRAVRQKSSSQVSENNESNIVKVSIINFVKQISRGNLIAMVGIYFYIYIYFFISFSYLACLFLEIF